jgi:hypothetical protein
MKAKRGCLLRKPPARPAGGSKGSLGLINETLAKVKSAYLTAITLEALI